MNPRTKAATLILLLSLTTGVFAAPPKATSTPPKIPALVAKAKQDLEEEKQAASLRVSLANLCALVLESALRSGEKLVAEKKYAIAATRGARAECGWPGRPSPTFRETR